MQYGTFREFFIIFLEKGVRFIVLTDKLESKRSFLKEIIRFLKVGSVEPGPLLIIRTLGKLVLK
jgi:hypothetical protein